MKRAGGIALVVLLLAGAFTLGLLHTRAPARAPAAIPDASRPHPGLVDEIRHELLTHYYRPVPARVLRQKTVDGMLRALNDRYTDYLSAVEYDALKDRTAKSYSGIGLTVEPSKQGLVVRAALDGPAREAGINRGDVIVAIDGRPVRKLPFERSLMLIQGKEGTSVRLTVIGPRGGRKVVTVVREEIAVSATRARLLRAGKAKLGYVRLLSFPAGAAESVKRRIASLLRRGAEGVILDLRNNPGGLLSQAVLTVSLFDDEGIVCTTDGLHQKRRVYEVEGDARYPKLPLVVLVNRGSASAAEIVAAALRDNRRAVVVGERTYGKAAVQTVRELANGEALKITTAVFLTPAGVNLTRHGVRPTVRAVDHRRTRRDEALLAAESALLDKVR
jgi:carboxyl-terminal processing protease